MSEDHRKQTRPQTDKDSDPTPEKVKPTERGDAPISEDELAREQAADDGWPDPSQQPE